MRFGFALHGSRGDVQPGVAIAEALRDRGHQVRLATAEDIVPAVARTGLDVVALCPDNAELMRSPLLQERLVSPKPWVRMDALKEMGAFGAEQSERVMGELAADSDALITSMLAQDRAATIAEHAGIPFVPLDYCPVLPNSSVPLPGVVIPGRLRPVVWRMLARIYWWSVRDGDRALRRRLGMDGPDGPLPGRMAAAGATEIQAYDPLLFPGLAQEWGSRLPFTGFLVPTEAARRAFNDSGEDAEAAEADVIDWATSDTAPVYVGFGSLPVARDKMQRVVDALLQRGARVIAHGQHDLTASAQVYRLTVPVDHDELLPHCAGAVHLGGAGTTAAALRTGIPAVIGWVSADQPLWAAGLKRLGAGGGAPLAKIGPADLDPIFDARVRAGAQRAAAQLISLPQARERACDILLDVVA